jgi:TRAP-type C4-dicarboxylate transport system permease large subunit
MPGAPDSSVDASPQPHGAICRVTLSWPEIGLRDRATGHFLVTVGGGEPDAVAYDITRTSSLDVFVWIFAAALLAGLTARWMLAKIIDTKEVPEDWSFKDAYASTFTALVVAAAALLTATGVLDEYAPQYSVAGPFAASLVVGLLLLVGPLLFSMARKDNHNERRRVFALAGGVVIVAAVAELGLVVLVIINGSWPGFGKLSVVVCAVVSLLILFGYAARLAWLLKEEQFRGSASL